MNGLDETDWKTVSASWQRTAEMREELLQNCRFSNKVLTRALADRNSQCNTLLERAQRAEEDLEIYKTLRNLEEGM